MASSFSGSKAKNRARQIGRRREVVSQRFLRIREEDPLNQRAGNRSTHHIPANASRNHGRPVGFGWAAGNSTAA